MSSFFNSSGGPIGSDVDSFVNPPFLSMMRTPTTQDMQNPGTNWLDGSQNPPVIYETTGAGRWYQAGGFPASTTLYGTVLLTDNSEPVAT